jgi:hypothetical protein
MGVTRAEEIAWAAGLFEGEGCITESDGRLNTRITNTDDSVLERFRDIVDAGTVYGPYERHERDGFDRKPVFVWVAAEESALDVLALFGPWLSARRLERAYELTGICFEHPVRTGRFHVTDE